MQKTHKHFFLKFLCLCQNYLENIFNTDIFFSLIFPPRLSNSFYARPLDGVVNCNKRAYLVGHNLSFNCLEYFGAFEKRNFNFFFVALGTSIKCKQTATPPSGEQIKEFDMQDGKIKEKISVIFNCEKYRFQERQSQGFFEISCFSRFLLAE